MPMYELPHKATDDDRRHLRVRELNEMIEKGFRPFVTTVRFSKGESLFPKLLANDGSAELYFDAKFAGEARHYRLTGAQIVVLYEQIEKSLGEEGPSDS